MGRGTFALSNRVSEKDESDFRLLISTGKKPASKSMSMYTQDVNKGSIIEDEKELNDLAQALASSNEF